jgi:hypothetical protein
MRRRRICSHATDRGMPPAFEARLVLKMRARIPLEAHYMGEIGAVRAATRPVMIKSIPLALCELSRR